MADKQPMELVPNDWYEEVATSISYEPNNEPNIAPDQIVIDADTIGKFNRLNGQAVSHAKARGEHDSMLFMTLYAIWNKSLWKASYANWEDYCDEWDSSPYGVSKSSIKHKIADIRRLLLAGADVATIIKVMSRIPMAGRDLANKLVDPWSEQVNQDIVDKIPSGMTVGQYLGELAELSATEARRSINHEFGDTFYFVKDAVYIADRDELLFKLVSRSPAGDLEADMVISNVPEWAANYLIDRRLRPLAAKYRIA